MKKFVAIAACTFPLVFAPTLYAQTTSAGGSSAGGTTGAGSTTPAPTTPTAPGNQRSSDGDARPADGATGTPGAGASGAGADASSSTNGTGTGAAGTGAAGTGTGAMGTDAAGANGAASASSDVTEAITGWSVKDKIMGKAVVNENDEKIGDVNDVVLASDGKAAYFIVGAGGFLGMGERDVAIPFDDITQSEDKLVLQGYTKDKLKALPKVEVAK